MSGYYDRAGEPITLDEWCDAFTSGIKVAIDTVGVNHVSTVWVGVDDNPGEGPPLIFETLISPGGNYCQRYSTEAEARAGHDEAVLLLRATT